MTVQDLIEALHGMASPLHHIALLVRGQEGMLQSVEFKRIDDGEEQPRYVLYLKDTHR